MTSGETVRAEILVSGRVQGVGFRRFARNAAERLGVESNPKNLRDGRVFVIAEGNLNLCNFILLNSGKGPCLLMWNMSMSLLRKPLEMFTKPFEKRLERKSRKKVRSMSIQLFSTFLKKGLSKKAGKRHGKCLFSFFSVSLQ